MVGGCVGWWLGEWGNRVKLHGSLLSVCVCLVSGWGVGRGSQPAMRKHRSETRWLEDVVGRMANLAPAAKAA